MSRKPIVNGPHEGLFLQGCNLGCLAAIIVVCVLVASGVYGLWVISNHTPTPPTSRSAPATPTQPTAPAQDGSTEAPFVPIIPIPDDGEAEYGRLLLEYDKFEDRTTITAPIPLTTVDGKQGMLKVHVRMSGKHWEGSDLSRVGLFITDFEVHDIMAGGVNFVIESDGESERVSPDSDSSHFGYLELDQLDQIMQADQIELKWGVLRFEFGDEARSLLREFRQAVEDSKR